MKVVVVAGLPGTGKTTIAEAIARKYKIPCFAKDWIQATLDHIRPNNGSEICDETTIREDGYEIMSMLEERQLMLGQSVILEGVIQKKTTRKIWRDIAHKFRAEWHIIECTCSDENLHKARLAGRRRHIPNWHEVTWKRVKLFQEIYEPWDEYRLILDAVLPVSQNIYDACCFVER